MGQNTRFGLVLHVSAYVQELNFHPVHPYFFFLGGGGGGLVGCFTSQSTTMVIGEGQFTSPFPGQA